MGNRNVLSVIIVCVRLNWDYNKVFLLLSYHSLLVVVKNGTTEGDSLVGCFCGVLQ